MAEAPNPFVRKVSLGRQRPSPSSIQPSAQPSSPHTPLLSRSVSSLYGGSPSGSFRSDDEYLVIELGSRFMRAGFAGESTPRSTMDFGPEEQRRVGDYRRWMPEHSTTRRKRKRGQDWGQEHELWRMDLRDVDLALVEDKLERAMREAQSRHLLMDSKPKKLVLALPPMLPRPLLSVLLTTLFNSFQTPSITLMPGPIVSTVAAGLRSALVVDIGWAETTVTAVYEYREALQRRSVRAGRMLSEEVGSLLDEEVKKTATTSPSPTMFSDHADEVSFEEAEEVLVRMVWCNSHSQATSPTAHQTSPSSSSSSSSDSFHDASELLDSDPTISIPLRLAQPPTTLHLPFSRLSHPVECALFAASTPPDQLDDHDQPLHQLIYRALLALPLDVRKELLPRIVFTGGVSHLPGLKPRLLASLRHLIEQRGWDPVKRYGSASAHRAPHNRRRRTSAQNDGATATPKHDSESESGTITAHPSTPGIRTSSMPAAAPHANPATTPLTPDSVLQKIRHATSRSVPPSPPPSPRAIETLGPWAGASMLATLRIKGLVEIERERFLAHGLAGYGGGGAGTGREASVVQGRQSFGGAVGGRGAVGGGGGVGEKGAFTLGVWA